MGLEPFYATTRSNILGIEPLPSIHVVYSRLVQEEEVRTLNKRRTNATTPMAFAIQKNVSQNSKHGGLHVLLGSAPTVVKMDILRIVVGRNMDTRKVENV